MPPFSHGRVGRKRLKTIAFGSLLALHLAIAPVAAARDSGASETYPADFFKPFSPQTALDMVQHLPGFRFDPGDESVRGFSEAGGNVLIDGERPATKSGGLLAALSAIPAKQVTRIDIIRGGGTANASSGQSVLANIVRAGGGRSLAAATDLSLVDGHVTGGASVTLTRAIGNVDLSSRTALDGKGERSSGTRTTFDAAGNRTRLEDLTYQADFPELSERLGLDGPLAGGRIKAGAMLARARLAETFTFADDAATESAPKRSKRWRGEISADWSRGIGRDYMVKLLTLARFTTFDQTSLSLTGTGGALKTSDLFESTSLSRETILRATLAKGGNATWQPELGTEIAWNSLDSHSALMKFDGGGVPVSRAAADILVSETRLDAFAKLAWRPAPRWMAEAGIAYETSRISARGDASSRRGFGLLKPRVTLSFKPDDRRDLRLSLRRTVGQLAFGDFAASANLADGTTSSGNPHLGPDHRMTASFDYDWRFGKRGAFNLNAYYDWRHGMLEAAVLPSGAFGVVNTGSARVWNVATTLELPTAPYIPGGLFKLRYALQRSRVVDPVTGTRRSINNSHPTELAGSFRQDFATANISWGIDYARGFLNQIWYADEAREQRHYQELNLFVETGRFLNARLRLEVRGLDGTRNAYRRLLYSPDRTGTVNRSEIWDIRTPTVVTLSASRNF